MSKKILLMAIVALVFGLIGSLISAWRYIPATPDSPEVANLFAHKMEDVAKRKHNLSSYQGKTLIVNFWATWCAPCVEEMPELVELQTEYSTDKLQVLGISIDSPNNVKEFAEKYKISYPLLLAGMLGTELARSFGNPSGGLPFTVLITPSGAVKKTYLGRLNMAELRADLPAP
ncbi:MAG: TlpA disulfide reductase family protein [Oxalicibacterium faecigallinarum]|uniref:TlpA disulfide reductase family protein n=1 Tax=Oxalicibacterium faecigallinarum TaxID=573741 RepID=UPI002808698A|nr:TlpA disulfide reductase family protein [Oxalicibacterium faecigallinarum]MDQ7969889.1 TlpA disulfide reductase family protein [Oxalicibacterium faecigallinarum]